MRITTEPQDRPTLRLLNVEPQTRAWSKDESGRSFTHTFPPEVITVFPPHSWGSLWPVEFLSEIPGSWSDSLSTSGMGPDWGLTFPQGLTEFRLNCQVSWSTSLWSPVGEDYLEGWNSRVKDDLEYHRVASCLILSQVLLYSGTAQLPAQGARMVGISLGPPEMLWKYFQTRN
jgi:hypothetical protein